MTRPETPVEALAAALHSDRNSHASGSVCDSDCATWVMDMREAEGLVDALAEVGWHLSADMALPSSVPAGDPRTAPSSIDDLSDRQWGCWWVLGLYCDGLTSDELAERYELNRQTFNLAPQSAASIRSRLAELARAGHVLKTQERRRTPNGGSAVVWRAVDERQRTVAA